VPRQGEALSEFAFLIRAHNARIFRVALRQEQAAVVGGERRASGGRQGGVELLPQGGALLLERTCHHSNRHETALELANSNDAHAISSITSSIIGCFGTLLNLTR
jgi:hypothetical protein